MWQLAAESAWPTPGNPGRTRGVQPAPGQSWAPSAADLAHLGAAGRTLVAELLAVFELGAIEGRLLLEVARAKDVLAVLREAEHADATRFRLEVLWSRHLAGLLGQLHVERTP